MTDNNNNNLVHTTLQGAMWIYVSTYSAKFLVFVSTAILARLLTPEEFGVAGYALVFMGFLDVLRGFGVRQALVYYRKRPERTNTAFWLGLGIGFLLYGITMALAPLTEWFFDDARAVTVTRVLALGMPISSIGLVHRALLRKDLAFKQKLVPELGRSLAKGVLSIVLALSGFGYWSLILGHLGGGVVNVLLLWKVIPWRPKLGFERAEAKKLFSYGWKVALNAGLGFALMNMDYLLIGRYLGAATLGVYTVAFRIPQFAIQQFTGIIGKVIFPVYAKMREQGQNVGQGFLVTMQYVNMVTLPLGMGLALLAEPLILVIFSDKWVDAIPVTRAIALYSMLRASLFNVGDVYKAQGRPGLLAKIKLAQMLLTVPALFWATAVQQSVVVIAWTQFSLALLFSVVRVLIASRILDTPLRAIGAVLHRTVAAVALMSFAVLGVVGLTAEAMPIVTLIAGVSVGGVVYLGALWVFNRKLVLEARQTLQAAFSRR